MTTTTRPHVHPAMPVGELLDTIGDTPIGDTIDVHGLTVLGDVKSLQAIADALELDVAWHHRRNGHTATMTIEGRQ